MRCLASPWPPRPAALPSHVRGRGLQRERSPSLPFPLQSCRGRVRGCSQHPQETWDPGPHQAVNKGETWPPRTCREPVMGASRQLCRPHGGDWGWGCFRLRARTLADPEGGGVHPLWTQGATCLSPSRPLRTALWSPVNACRHGHTCAHLAHKHHTYITPDMQHMHMTHTRHMQVHACVHTRAHHMPHAYTPHTQCTRMHTSHADT